MNKIYDNGILLYLIHCGLKTRLLFTLTFWQKLLEGIHTKKSRIGGLWYKIGFQLTFDLRFSL